MTNEERAAMTNLSESVCRVCGQEEDLLRHDRYGEATRDCFDHDFDPIFVAAPAATPKSTGEEPPPPYVLLAHPLNVESRRAAGFPAEPTFAPAATEGVCATCGGTRGPSFMQHQEINHVFVSTYPAATEEPTMERATFVRRMPSPDDDYTQWRAPWGHIFDVHDSVVAAIRDEQAATIQRLRERIEEALMVGLHTRTYREGYDRMRAALAISAAPEDWCAFPFYPLVGHEIDREHPRPCGRPESDPVHQPFFADGSPLHVFVAPEEGGRDG